MTGSGAAHDASGPASPPSGDGEPTVVAPRTGKGSQALVKLGCRLPPRRRGLQPHELLARADQIAGHGENLTDDHTPELTVLNEEINRRLDRQFDTITQLDTKAGLLVTFAATVAGLLLNRSHSDVTYAAVASFAVTVALGLSCLAARSWSTAPRPDLLPSLERVDAVIVFDRLLRAKVIAELRNEAGMVRKAVWLKATTWSQLVPVVISLFALR